MKIYMIQNQKKKYMKQSFKRYLNLYKKSLGIKNNKDKKHKIKY